MILDNDVRYLLLLHILTAPPLPTFPQWVTFFPMSISTAFAFSKSAGSLAPTMKVSVPAFAANTPPETGASTKVASLSTFGQRKVILDYLHCS